jgi:transposase
VRVGLETGPLTPWLVHGLRGRGLEVVCLDARQARAALALRPNKTDANDAEGLAQILRLGWHRSVHVKSYAAHQLRASLGARMRLVNMVTELSNHVRGVLKVFGLIVEGARGGAFADRVEALVADRPEVAAVVRPMLEAWRGLRRQVAAYDVALRAVAKERHETRLLMSVPGVGAITALAFASAVEDPARFGRSRNVGAHFGLTPRQHQSGDLPLGRRAGANLPLRGRHRAAPAGEALVAAEGLGGAPGAAGRRDQGARGTGAQARRGYARDLAQRRAVPLDRRAAGGLIGKEGTG